MHGRLDDCQVGRADGQGAVGLRFEDIDRIPADRLHLLHQLRSVERTAVGDRSNVGRHLQRRHQYLALADGDAGRIQAVGGIRDGAGGFGHLADSGGLAQAEGPGHRGNGVLVLAAILGIQRIADMVEPGIARAHQTHWQR